VYLFPGGHNLPTNGCMVMLAEDDRLAASLRGFGSIGILSIGAILLPGNWMIGEIFAVPVSALLVLAWVRVSRTPWREIGYVQPMNWLGVLIGGAAAGILFKLVMKILVMPLLGRIPSITHIISWQEIGPCCRPPCGAC
jgi:hypothetical protein